MQDVPHAPKHAPTRVEELTQGTQIVVSYEALHEIESGGASILSYNLQIDMQGGGSGKTSVVVNVNASGNSNVQGDQAQAKQLGLAVSAAVQAELVTGLRLGPVLGSLWLVMSTCSSILGDSLSNNMNSTGNS